MTAATTALTRLAEGQPDWVIQAQLGHVSPSMMKTYSHIRRKAPDAAAAALQPVYHQRESASSGQTDDIPLADEVTSQSTSQSGISDGEDVESIEENGSSGWTRTRSLCL
jgi:hypothetical protein